MPDGANPIHSLLNELDLPWTEPRREIEVRVGVSLDPFYKRDTLFFPEATVPPGFVRPWQAGVFERFAPEMPIVRFSGIAWFTDDTTANTQRMADYFAGRLGSATIGQQYNTLTCRWQAGTASLQLTSWPPSWQSPGLQNDSHALDPRLITACHVSLMTGFRLPLSAEEKEWVRGARPVAEVRPIASSEAGGIEDTAPWETEVEYARSPGEYLANLQGRISCPPGREALILVTHQLFVLPAKDLLGFKVIRLLPAKGEGGSTLFVRVRTSCCGLSYKTLRVADDRGPDGVTGLGETLARLFDLPCEVAPYIDDA